MAEEENTAKPVRHEIQFPLIWTGVDEMLPQYANQALIQFDGSAFQLCFGVVSPPILIDENQGELLTNPPAVFCRPIARLALPPAAAKDLARILTDGLQAFQEATNGANDGD
jgi:hypothetical protein